MSFSHIKTISFASLTDKVINLNHLIDDQSVFSNLFKYKVDIIKNKYAWLVTINPQSFVYLKILLIRRPLFFSNSLSL